MLKYSSRLRFWMVHFLNLVFEKHSTDVVAGPMLSHVVDFVVWGMTCCFTDYAPRSLTFSRVCVERMPSTGVLLHSVPLVLQETTCDVNAKQDHVLLNTYYYFSNKRIHSGTVRFKLVPMFSLLMSISLRYNHCMVTSCAFLLWWGFLHLQPRVGAVVFPALGVRAIAHL